MLGIKIMFKSTTSCKTKHRKTYLTNTEKKPIPTTDAQHARIQNAICNPFLQ